METEQFLETLDSEGLLLASAAERAGLDALVPTCPGWRVRDLVGHTGAVHRWATGFVAEEHTSPRPIADPPGQDSEEGADGDALLRWFREGHRRLVDTLAAASPDVRCWGFLPAPSPLAFWARRQAHETTVHRIDAESALGGTPDPIGAAFAADGIDELLTGFHVRAKSRVRSDSPRVLRIRVTDGTGGGDAGAPAVWTVRLSAEPVVTERGDGGDADCELAGPADQLYLALWNRRPFPEVRGDAELAALWRKTSAVV
ncbi:maleylpyruvate isomerase family mycothiol-dependent enzyme [Streptomyces sp. NPDC059785]|uniref:maleylpyruvate isomerase family mycothiol-dependent enzyme n=1 Tax=unclassified Streptomyces TaxID=2593676 RepID=UPI0036688F62